MALIPCVVGPWAIKNSRGLTDVEPVDPSTLQFSTSVELQLVLLVGWLVGWVVVFLKNGSKDFFDFLHEVTHQ